jgi:hypothetical protein
MAQRYRLSANLRYNIKSYLDREFINQGQYINIASGTFWRLGIRADTLSRVGDGSIYESNFNNWIYETDASGVNSDYRTILCSGVCVDGTWHAKNTSPHYAKVDYRKGRVHFTGTKPAASASVYTNLSYKHILVDFPDSDASNLLFSYIKNNVDYTGNQLPSGVDRQLPLVVVDLQKREGRPFALGGKKEYNQLVVFHILANNRQDNEQIADILSERSYRKVIKGVDLNNIPVLFDNQGDKASTYKDFTTMQGDASYFFPKIYVDEAKLVENWNEHGLFYSHVHWEVTLYKSAT